MITSSKALTVALLGFQYANARFSLASLFSSGRLLQEEIANQTEGNSTQNYGTLPDDNWNYNPPKNDLTVMKPPTDFTGKLYDCFDVCMAPCFCDIGVSVWAPIDEINYLNSTSAELDTTGMPVVGAPIKGSTSSSKKPASSSSRRPGSSSSSVSGSGSIPLQNATASNSTAANSTQQDFSQCEIVRHFKMMQESIPKCGNKNLCFCPTPCSQVTEAWNKWNTSAVRQGEVLVLTSEDFMPAANSSQSSNSSVTVDNSTVPVDNSTVVADNSTLPVNSSASVNATDFVNVTVMASSNSSSNSSSEPQAKNLWAWLDLFNWPFPAPSPRMNDATEAPVKGVIKDASEVFPQQPANQTANVTTNSTVVDNSTVPVDNSTVPLDNSTVPVDNSTAPVANETSASNSTILPGASGVTGSDETVIPPPTGAEDQISGVSTDDAE